MMDFWFFIFLNLQQKFVKSNQEHDFSSPYPIPIQYDVFKIRKRHHNQIKIYGLPFRILLHLLAFRFSSATNQTQTNSTESFIPTISHSNFKHVKTERKRAPRKKLIQALCLSVECCRSCRPPLVQRLPYILFSSTRVDNVVQFFVIFFAVCKERWKLYIYGAFVLVHFLCLFFLNSPIFLFFVLHFIKIDDYHHNHVFWSYLMQMCVNKENTIKQYEYNMKRSVRFYMFI